MKKYVLRGEDMPMPPSSEPSPPQLSLGALNPNFYWRSFIFMKLDPTEEDEFMLKAFYRKAYCTYIVWGKYPQIKGYCELSSRLITSDLLKLLPVGIEISQHHLSDNIGVDNATHEYGKAELL